MKGDLFKYVAPEHKADREIVFETVKQNADALKHAAAKPQADREFMIETVMQNGYALSYAAPENKAEVLKHSQGSSKRESLDDLGIGKTIAGVKGVRAKSNAIQAKDRVVELASTGGREVEPRTSVIEANRKYIRLSNM